MRLMVALVGMSVLAIAAVGSTARWMTARRFDDLVVERAVEGFIQEITAYYATWGSWERASQAESFHEFNGRGRGSGVRAGGPGARGGPDRPRPGERFGPDRGPRPLGSARPPFFVTDRAGTVLLDLAGYRVGDVVPLEKIESARPIMFEGTEIGLAVAADRPVLTEFEARYLSAIEDAWVYSLLFAGLLAIPIGLALGQHFARPIRELTHAIGRMRKGELRQSVAVRSQDELGQLAAAFNGMSQDLSEAYAQLEESKLRLGQQADELRDLSRRDDLTGLANRRAFDEQLRTLTDRAVRYGRPLAVALVDVDHFKAVNDNFSHSVGDQVLRTIAGLLDMHVRAADVTARYGGEEFAIAFPETDLPSAARLADRLRVIVAEHVWAATAPRLDITLSIGLAEISAGISPEEALAAADAKLYEAKNAGRDCVRF